MTENTYISSLPIVEEITLDDSVALSQFAENLTNPAIIRGIAADWPLVKTAKHSVDEFFNYIDSFDNHSQLTHVGMGTVPAKHQGRLFYNEAFTGFNFSRKNVEFPSFISEIRQAASNADGTAHYMGSTNVDRLLPNIRQDNDIKALAGLNPLVSIWLSNQTVVAAHQDFPDNLAVCVAGKRRFTLFPPEQISNLYIGPLDKTPAGQPISLVDHRNPDFSEHPKYKTALTSAVVAELSPGDALFIPSLWWHSVESLAPINVLINYWWQKTPNYIGSPMDALFHSIMNIGTLTNKQKLAMKALFDEYVFDDKTHDFAHIPENAQGILAKDELANRQLRAMLLNKLNQ